MQEPVIDYARALTLYVERWRALPDDVRAQAIADDRAARARLSR